MSLIKASVWRQQGPTSSLLRLVRFLWNRFLVCSHDDDIHVHIALPRDSGPSNRLHRMVLYVPSYNLSSRKYIILQINDTIFFAMVYCSNVLRKIAPVSGFFGYHSGRDLRLWKIITVGLNRSRKKRGKTEHSSTMQCLVYNLSNIYEINREIVVLCNRCIHYICTSMYNHI